MRSLIESTFVSLGDDIGAPQEWGPPYLDCADGDALNHGLLFGADALVLGRKTYEGLSAGYTAPLLLASGFSRAWPLSAWT